MRNFVMKLRKLLVLLLAAVMVFSVLPINASAECHEHSCRIVSETATMYSHFKCTLCGACIVLTSDGATVVSEESLRKPGSTDVQSLPEGSIVQVDTTSQSSTTQKSTAQSGTAGSASSSIGNSFNYPGSVNWALSNCFENQWDTCSAYVCKALYYGGGLPYMPFYDHVGEMALTIIGLGYGTLFDANSYTVPWIEPGDVILVHDPMQFDGNFGHYGLHCMIVTGVDYYNQVIYYCQHNPTYANKAVKFSSLYDGSYARNWSTTAGVQFIHMNK